MNKIICYISICFFSFLTTVRGQPINILSRDSSVGIGTTTVDPTLNLKVVGSSLFNGRTSLGTNTYGGTNDHGIYWPNRGNLINELAIHAQTAGMMFYANPSTSSYPGLFVGSTFPQSSVGIMSNPSFPLVFGVGGEKMRIHTNGNVGIGNIAPIAALDIYSTTVPLKVLARNPSALQRSIGMYSYTSGAVGTLFTGTVKPTNLSVSEAGTVLTNYGGVETGNSRFRVTIANTDNNNQSPFAATSYYDALVVNNNGNVGLGITTPNARLHLQNGGTIATTGDVASNDALFVGPNKDNPVQGNLAVYSHNAFAINTGGSLVFGGKFSSSNPDHVASYAKIKAGKTNGNDGDYSGYLSFFTRLNMVAPAERMRIDNNGNVGIGTTTPTQKLEVAGNLLATGKVIIGSGVDISKITDYALAIKGTAVATKVVIRTYLNWPDYVFESNYKLQPLSSLEYFIKINKHLPDIPSAEEVKKEGIDLGENQAALLKKIEELTLYLLEQNKRNDEQQKLIEDQHKLLLELKAQINKQ